ncbi:sulfotransferase family 2 domain-containing protein [Aureitalea sp. L0-47]|uniref:sulfotransferase family protein n=1 Tax=Aureitalea sp. L0-47 TaxID=2816962 RepID=UPI0022380EC7|nr:sulfotransferase family protein [Aureitalea sp. L0-47]MCW5519174.1 sulfotransferase family 2 domain-containing protein [Aureitalea sp. L0-47]
MIDHKKKLLFIHVPKNAGTSIERVVFDSYDFSKGWSREYLYGFDQELGFNLQHATLKQLLDHELISKEVLETYDSFAVVRNPFTRAISGYTWLMKDLRIEGSLRDFLTREGAFSEEALKQAPHFVNDHFYTQSEFVTMNGEIAVDKLLKFEDLAADFRRFANKVSPKLKLTSHFKKNRRKKRDLAKLITSENEQLIREIYRDDFINFNYRDRFSKWKYFLGYA